MVSYDVSGSYDIKYTYTLLKQFRKKSVCVHTHSILMHSYEYLIKSRLKYYYERDFFLIQENKPHIMTALFWCGAWFCTPPPVFLFF